MQDTTDRRRATRRAVDLTCKVMRDDAASYAAGRTCNLSASGVLLELHTARPIVAGERVSVGVSWAAKPLIRAESLLKGRVVRAGTLEGRRQQVAIEFDRPASASEPMVAQAA